MADYNHNYNSDYDDYNTGDAPAKSIKGYKVVIIILAVILAALSILYFQQFNQMKQEYSIERDSLISQVTSLIDNNANLTTSNDTLAQGLAIQRSKADSLLQRIQQERSFNASKIRKYEKELGTLRSVMRGFVQQIDSLNTLNKKLINENVDFRKQVTTQRMRADMAEEKADELSTKIRKGSVIRARDIKLVALSNSDREVTRASRAASLRVDFILSANELATPGERNIYARITGPDGYVMANQSNALFSFEGDMITYSAIRQIDYQNQDLEVHLFYNGSGITAGKYKVAIYMDGYQIGSNEIILR